jgi:hypothetical protein
MNKPMGILALLLLSLLAYQAYIPNVQAGQTTVYVYPDRKTGMDVGETVKVEIKVENVIDLRTWEVQIFYKSSVLNASAITSPMEKCPFFNEKGIPSSDQFYGIYSFTDNFNATHGQVIAYCAIQNASVSGSGTLLWINFTAVNYGDTSIDIGPVFEGATILRDSNLDSIPHLTIDGVVHVGLHDVSITKITINEQVMEAPISIPVNSIAKIYVTAENQGEVPETVFDITLYYDNNQIGTTTIIDMPAGGIQILSFTWATSGLPIGEYTLKATATTVPGEVDLSDNTHISSPVYIGLRDIALTNIAPSKTITNDTTVYINVTAKNNGETGTPSQTFNLTLQYGTKTIGTQTVANLTVGSTKTLTFTWNTMVVPVGTYLISAIATTVPGETNTENNVEATVIIETIKGDVTGDFKVDIYDLYQFARAYDTTPEDPKWNPNCDLNDDERISIGDLFYAARNYGKEI